jgi:hypothetical protein
MCTTIYCFALTVFIPADPAPTWNRDYGLAMRQATAAQKPVAVFIGSGKEGWKTVCDEGDLSPQVRRLLMDHYVCVYIDAAQALAGGLVRSFDAGAKPLVVLSCHDCIYEAYRHAGTLTNASLAEALERHAVRNVPAVYPATPAPCRV